MPYHDYTAKDALDLLMRRIDDVSPIIARQIQSAIDTGKDLQVEEPTPAELGKRRAKKRYFRKHAAYTDEQALEVAITVLESHLIENRMMVNAAQEEFRLVGLALPKPNAVIFPGDSSKPISGSDVEMIDNVTELYRLAEPKAIAVEGEPEVVKEKKNIPDLRFVPPDPEEISSLQEMFRRLKMLTNFQKAKHGKPN